MFTGNLLTVASDCGFTPLHQLQHMLLSPTSRKRISVDCWTPNRQLDWSAINKKWAGPLLAYPPKFDVAACRGEAAIVSDCIGTSCFAR